VARVLVTLHLLLTSYVVVVTGNHFWLDGIVAAVIVAVAWPIVAKASRSRGASTLARSDEPSLPAQPVADFVP
jgi:hypothetical protein